MRDEDRGERKDDTGKCRRPDHAADVGQVPQADDEEQGDGERFPVVGEDIVRRMPQRDSKECRSAGERELQENQLRHSIAKNFEIYRFLEVQHGVKGASAKNQQARSKHLGRWNLTNRLADGVDQQDEDAYAEWISKEAGCLGLALADCATSGAGRNPPCNRGNVLPDPRASKRRGWHSASFGVSEAAGGTPEAHWRTTC